MNRLAYTDLPRTANDIHDIVYGLGTDIDKRGEILAWLEKSKPQGNIFVLALEWTREVSMREVTQ